MVILKKGNISIAVEEKGAEIKSFKIDNEEFLWNRSEYWGKTSPVLFPFVGGLRENKYEFEGKEYSITTRHGFARDNVFTLSNQDENSLEFKFSSNEDTLKVYPFNFNLYLTYTLTEKGFNLNYRVENLDDKTMYFSIGAHPAFVLDQDYEETSYIEFEKEEPSEKWIINEKGFICAKVSHELKNNKIQEIKEEAFVNDAIIFENTNSDKLYIRNTKNAKEVMVDYTGFPYVAFWKAKDAPFVCIEPWYGITDFQKESYDLKEKEGIQTLDAKASFNATLKFEFKKGN